jgi:iron complex outermembrane receptor protein
MFSYQHPTLGNLQLTYSRQVNHREEYDNHTILDTLGNEVAALNYKITTQTLDAFWRMKKAGNFRTSGGVSVMTQANLMGGARYFLPNYINYTGGVFAATRYKKEKWEWEVGARYDYRYMEVYLYENKIFQKDILRFSNISFNGGFLWRDEHWKISGNIGRAWRAPGMNELYSNGLHHGSAALEVGNRTLKEEKAWKGIANISFSHPNWECEIAPYSHYFQNYIYLQPTQKIVLTVRGAFPEFEYRQARAWLNGCDYQFKYSPDAHFSFFTKGAMLYARNLTTQTGLILMPPNRMEHGISYKGKGLKWAKTPTISANILHVFRQNNIPPNQDFTPAPQAYYLVGMESSCTIDWGKNALHLGIGVQNLLNKRYRDYLDRFRYFADAQGRNISFRAAIHINQ